tara:strand:- start:934 stop:1143 length:210 start_codon:yes stop_codon:yes gene_type:complete
VIALGLPQSGLVSDATPITKRAEEWACTVAIFTEEESGGLGFVLKMQKLFAMAVTNTSVHSLTFTLNIS